MPNIATVLKQEIARLSRREARGQVSTLKKASNQYRHNIAALKRQVSKLERQVALLAGKVLSGPSGSSVPAAQAGDDGQAPRFMAKGLRSHRKKLGISADDYGRLIGVSGQSVYNWERGSARPRASQIAALAAVRSIGKREALVRLEQAAGGAAKRAAKSAKK